VQTSVESLYLSETLGRCIMLTNLFATPWMHRRTRRALSLILLDRGGDNLVLSIRDG